MDQAYLWQHIKCHCFLLSTKHLITELISNIMPFDTVSNFEKGLGNRTYMYVYMYLRLIEGYWGCKISSACAGVVWYVDL